MYYALGAFLKAKCRENEETVDEGKARLIEEAAWKCSLNIQEIATLVPIDCSDLRFVQRFHSIHGNFGDDLVLVAARRFRADYLVTSDRKLLRKSSVAALSPEDMLALFVSFESFGRAGQADDATTGA